MPTNERANKLREKKRQKDRKTKIIIWSVLGLIILTIVIMKICEIDFADVKNKISANTTISTVADGYPYSLDISGKADVEVVNDKLAVLTDTSLSVIDPSNAKKIDSFDHGYSNPIMTTAGNYTCIYDRGATRLRVDTANRSVYEKNTKRNIICASIASNGTVAYAVFSDDADCELIVMSRLEKVKMSLPIKDGYITRLAINSSGTKCVYVTVSTVDAAVVSTVHTINVGDAQDSATATYESSNILDVTYCTANDAYIIGNDFLSIASSKEFKDVFQKGSINVNNYCFTKNRELVLNYKDYSNSAESDIAYIKSNGNVKSKTTVSEEVLYLSSSGNSITVLVPDKINIYSLNKCELNRSEECDSSVNSVHTLGSKSYVQYGQYIDVL